MVRKEKGKQDHRFTAHWKLVTQTLMVVERHKKEELQHFNMLLVLKQSNNWDEYTQTLHGLCAQTHI